MSGASEVPVTSNNLNSQPNPDVATNRLDNLAPSSFSERAGPNAPFVYCANCCVQIPSETPSSERKKFAFGSLLPQKKVTVFQALQTIFFTYSTTDCPPLSPVISRNPADDGRFICGTCAKSLGNSYTYFIKFKESMKQGSYLETKLRPRVDKNPSIVPFVLEKGINNQGFITYSLKLPQPMLSQPKVSEIRMNTLQSQGQTSSASKSGQRLILPLPQLPEQVSSVVSNLQLVTKPVEPPPKPKNLTVPEIRKLVNRSARQKEKFYNYVRNTVSKEVKKLSRESVYFHGPKVLTKEEDLFPDDWLIIREVKSDAPLFFKVLQGIMGNNSRADCVDFPPEFRSVVAIILRNRHSHALRFHKYVTLQMLKNKNNVAKMADNLTQFSLCSSWKSLMRLMKTLEENDIVIQADQDEAGADGENEDSNASDSNSENSEDKTDKTETEHTSSPDLSSVKIEVDDDEQAEDESSSINVATSVSLTEKEHQRGDLQLLDQEIKTEEPSPPSSPPPAKTPSDPKDLEMLLTDTPEVIELENEPSSCNNSTKKNTATAIQPVKVVLPDHDYVSGISNLTHKAHTRESVSSPEETSEPTQKRPRLE